MSRILGEDFDGKSQSDADPNELPAMPMEAQSVRGEVYQCGPHLVMCGDSSDAGDVATLIGADIAVMVLADPPYNVGYGVETSRRKEPQGKDRPQQVRTDLYDDSLPVEGYRDFLAAIPAISADGHFVAFESDATNLVADDTNVHTHVFVRGPLA